MSKATNLIKSINSILESFRRPTSEAMNRTIRLYSLDDREMSSHYPELSSYYESVVQFAMLLSNNCMDVVEQSCYLSDKGRLVEISFEISDIPEEEYDAYNFLESQFKKWSHNRWIYDDKLNKIRYVISGNREGGIDTSFVVQAYYYARSRATQLAA